MLRGESYRAPSAADRAFMDARNRAAMHAARGDIFLGLAHRALIPTGGTYRNHGYGLQPVYRTEGARKRAELASKFWMGAHHVKEAFRTKSEAEKKHKRHERRQAIIFRLFGGQEDFRVPPPAPTMNAKRASEDPRFLPSLDPDYAKRWQKEQDAKAKAKETTPQETQATPNNPVQDTPQEQVQQEETVPTPEATVFNPETSSTLPQPETAREPSLSERLAERRAAHKRQQRLRDDLKARRMEKKGLEENAEEDMEPPLVIDQQDIEAAEEERKRMQGPKMEGGKDFQK